ncbi:MAG: hypothetical protein ABIH29_00150 [Candidatus Micrarchaeota archaeon]
MAEPERRPADVTVQMPTEAQARARAGQAFDAAMRVFVEANFTDVPSAADLQRLHEAIGRQGRGPGAIHDALQGLITAANSPMEDLRIDLGWQLQWYFQVTNEGTSWIRHGAGGTTVDMNELRNSVIASFSALREEIVTDVVRMADQRDTRRIELTDFAEITRRLGFGNADEDRELIDGLRTGITQALQAQGLPVVIEGSGQTFALVFTGNLREAPTVEHDMTSRLDAVPRRERRA